MYERNNNSLEQLNFKALIEESKTDRIEDRLNVLNAFLATPGHVSLEEMHNILKEKGYDYDLQFVSQCLTDMVDLGFAQKKHFEGQPIKYEHLHLGLHHDHFICTKCGKIVEFSNEEIERLQAKVASDYGFYMLQHRMDIYGICSACMKQRQPLIPLAMAKSGEKLKIQRIVGGKMACGRLFGLGLRPGDSIEIINNSGMGRIIIGHKDTRLAISRRMAMKIIVSIDTNHKI